MMSFGDFIQKNSLKKYATSNTKTQQILSSLSLNSVGTYSKDGPFTTDVGIVDIHPTKGTH